MKFAVVILAVVAAASAQQYPGQYQAKPKYPYNQPQYKSPTITPKPYNFPTSTPAAYYSPPATYAPIKRTYDADAKNAQILKYFNELNPDGSYSYGIETSNGIAAQEQGAPRSFGGNPPLVGTAAQGSYQFTSPEGNLVLITYVADENGFQPQGDAIPTPHPIPEAILRSLAYNAQYNKE